MTYRMADAIDPSQLPPGMDAYAGYVNGRWPDFPAIASAHPGRLVDLSVYLANVASAIDIEPGDATPDQAPTFVAERLQAGVWRPIVYGSRDAMPAIVDALTAAGISRAQYRLWSAHYGAGEHICGPGTCKALVQCDGTQWIDHGGWDESLLADDFFAPITSPQPAEEDDMAYLAIPDKWTCRTSDGAIYAQAGQPYLGGLNQHPEWHAGPLESNNTTAVCAFTESPDGGYTIWVFFTSDNQQHPYAFPADGSLAK